MSDRGLPSQPPDKAQVVALLRNAVSYMRQTYRRHSETGGWRQFLQEEGWASVTGTACVVTSLIEAGVSRTDEQVRAGRALLVAKARPDGGWTKPEYEQAISLTLVTCLSLHALDALRVDSSNPTVAAGFTWLANAQNHDGGWGNLGRDQRSDVTSTAYAMRALARSDTTSAQYHEQLNSAVSYLFAQRTADGAWGPRAGVEPTMAHTSHAVEALLAAGCKQKELEQTKSWLLVTGAAGGFTPWLEQYNLAERSNSTPTVPKELASSRLSWTHLPAERLLIALLSLGVEPTSQLISSLVVDIVERQHQDGYWKVPTVPGTAPSWAMLESVRSLSLYGEEIDRSRELTAVRQEIRAVSERIAVLERKYEELTRLHDGVLTRIQAVEVGERRLERLLRRSGQVVRQVAASPVLWAAVVVIVTTVVLVLYLNNWSVNNSAAERTVGVATILAPSVAIVALMKFKRRP